MEKFTILFIGDIFGEPGVRLMEAYLPEIKLKENIDFVVAQAENVSGRKGLIKSDFVRLKQAGVDAFTLGNHYLARAEIKEILKEPEIISPANLRSYYGSEGSKVFSLKGLKIRVTSLLGITFNKLSLPWGQREANNFFDTVDDIIFRSKKFKEDIHVIDFHAETTSEKSVLANYVDGKVDAVVGTHTHVQTNDARILPSGTFFITDLGMSGPRDSAIGVEYEDVYRMLRYKEKTSFSVSKSPCQFNGVILEILPNKHKKFKVLNIYFGNDNNK